MKPVAYITGASRGLGRCVAERLAGRYALGLGCFHADPPHLPDSVILRGDVSRSDTSRMAAEELMRRFGRIDLFIANAAISVDRPFLRMKDEEWDDVIRTNLSAVFFGLRETAGPLRQAGGSAILVSSILGRRGESGSANYCAAKAGVIALARSAAREWAPQARVNVFIPGYMPTDMGMQNPDVLRNAVADHLGGTMTPVEEAADLMIALAETKTVTGQIITADGRIS
ncbi:MAG: SDR family oxidoreductase [Candidatus Hydrogenedentota bacterium]